MSGDLREGFKAVGEWMNEAGEGRERKLERERESGEGQGGREEICHSI